MKTARPWLALCSTLLLLLPACGPAPQPAATPEKSAVTGQAAVRTAAIAIPDRYGAQVAEDILKAGGNAVDAGVAVGFALAVTFIDAGNIGGGGFMLTYFDGEPAFLDYREVAPLASDRDMYLDAAGEVIENASLIGARAVGVPGTVAGLWEAHQRYGTLPWEELVMPAVKLAEEGFLAAPALVEDIRSEREWFGDSTNFQEYFGGISVSEPFRQPELARTLRRLAKLGAEDFYGGETARLIVEQMERSGGLITINDLESYRAVWREPLRAPWRDYQILAAPPPSSGGFAVIQLLKMKDELERQFAGLAHNSPQYIHLVAEMEKRVFADRAEYLGDPDFVDNRMDELLDGDYIRRRALEVNTREISQLDGVRPGLESPNTTHYSIVDGWGNAVSNTYTLNTSYGSGVVVEGAGFLLNDEMDDFSVKPGVPNFFGVVGNAANEIQPGKRMLSSMSPTILLRGDEVEVVVGTPGGSTIFTSVFQTIVNLTDYSMTPFDAVAATRFHHQLLPPDLITYSVTRPLPQDTISALAGRGYRAVPHDWEFGDVQLIQKRDGQWVPASDPRDRGESRVISIEDPQTPNR
ncbi:MAG: gamma-glutamyltransferase [Xanthomonadales bacterium]|nr:gamma-glutamyltransferase [Xanthomonadales bacterium]